ncbi:MAG: hypothetical protein N2595_02840 [bacterium]|nr:hypothetical protein [bacterium]
MTAYNAAPFESPVMVKEHDVAIAVGGAVGGSAVAPGGVAADKQEVGAALVVVGHVRDAGVRGGFVTPENRAGRVVIDDDGAGMGV